MKKKWMSLVLTLCVLCMCVSLVSCSGESTFSVISKAMEKTVALDSMAAEMKMDIEMAMEGMTLSIPITADIQAKDLKSDNPIMLSALTMTILGQDMEIEMYQEGDWAYMVMEDMKYKTSVADVESEYDYLDDMSNMLQDIPEELLRDVELKKNDDGSQSVTVSIPDEQFADIYDEFIAGLNSTTGTTEVNEVQISDAVVTITVADGYLSVYDMEFTMTMVVEGITTTTEAKASTTYKNPGEEVTVTPPEGYQDFEEMDLSV